MQVKQRWSNVQVVTPGGITERDVLIEGERIAALIERDAATGADVQVIDGGGHILFPGLIDTFQNGIGSDYYAHLKQGAVAQSSQYMLSRGCTAFLPSIGCTPDDRIEHVLATLAAECRTATGARALGIHAEGPCFGLLGAHDPKNMQLPSRQLAERMIRAADGKLRIHTVAPELPGAQEYIALFKEAGVCVHMGHTDAPPADVPLYHDWGIDAVTHMFDVMPQKPADGTGVHVLNLTDSLMAEAGLPLGLVCDGIHAQPRLVRLLAQLGWDRVFLQTDAIVNDRGAPIVFETFPGNVVTSKPGGAIRNHKGGLNGASVAPDDLLRNYVAFGGVGLVQAAHATSLIPARVIGMEADMGSIEPGKFADLTLLSPVKLGVLATMVGGQLLYEAA